jgi:hypothetical protein
VITRKVVEMAKGGHFAAIRLIIDRLAPRPRDQPVEFELPPLIVLYNGPRLLAKAPSAS